MHKFFKIAAMGLELLLVIAGLTAVAAAQDKVLQMATTTSTDNTGLLDDLAPKFKAATGIELRWVAVGTGKALELGKNCDVDVLLVHAPGAEKQFVADGYGVDRTQLMYNDFVIMGPRNDPAGVKGKKVAEALKVFAEKKVPFMSRGDNSGTHKLELALWRQNGISGIDQEPWYVQTGQGMLATINVAAERGGYTLTDRGTFIKYEDTMKGDPPLVILVEGDDQLFNQYSAMAVSPAKCPKAQYDLAKQFIHWMASPAAQKAIGDFKLLGKPLFTANAR
ncbi:MAG: tungsten ABC transporter substrate-binding protein [Syntrophobacteraceae bacterium CG2_30_61_12]|nr:MAG: tungsten ABC transporter substrate-binding protein [Syntrophobacteraceae bacterium CG2_30_61_12]PIU31290.1 MAG: tungsten ABC transporter substrate-binding protein [Syntrophobacteraceae bacterium CG07_land_8_20_14_0_80_61_8]